DGSIAKWTGSIANGRSRLESSASRFLVLVLLVTFIGSGFGGRFVSDICLAAKWDGRLQSSVHSLFGFILVSLVVARFIFNVRFIRLDRWLAKRTTRWFGYSFGGLAAEWTWPIGDWSRRFDLVKFVFVL